MTSNAGVISSTSYAIPVSRFCPGFRCAVWRARSCRWRHIGFPKTGNNSTATARCCWKPWSIRRAFAAPRIEPPTGSAKIPLKDIKEKPERAIQRTDRRNPVNAIKLATYNAERLLARKFFHHYRDMRDWLTIFRSLFHLSGSIQYEEDQVLVELEAPDRPHVRQALETTIQELNPMGSRLFGAGPRLVFSLKSSSSLPGSHYLLRRSSVPGSAKQVAHLTGNADKRGQARKRNASFALRLD